MTITLPKQLNSERIIHCIKTGIACWLGVLMTRLISLPSAQWVVITIIVVMCSQIYVGSVVSKSILRFLGTLVGCLFAALTLLIFGSTHLAVATTIALSGMLFAYMATGKESLSYTGQLGAVTTAIILLNPDPTFVVAAERFIEISVGILIAALISQFILPIHARTHLKRNQANTLDMLKDYYEWVMMSVKKDEQIDIKELDEAIVQSLINQRQLAKESKREPLAQSFDPKQFIQALFYEREILRAITYMRLSLNRLEGGTETLNPSFTLNAFNQDVVNTLTVMTTRINDPLAAHQTAPLPSVLPLKQELETAYQQRSYEHRISVGAFIFSAERLVYALTELSAIY